MSIAANIQNILIEYQNLLLTHLPDQIERLVLFGSYAREEAKPDSDVDVLVVVNWPQKRLPNGLYAAFSGDPRWKEIVNIATDLMLKHGVFISPTVVSKDRLSEPFPLIRQIEREGVELWPNHPN